MVSCALVAALAAAGPSVAHADAPPASVWANDGYQTEWQMSWAIYQLEQRSPVELRSVSTVELPITIKAPIAKVWSVYTNLHNDIGRHPFLKGIITHRAYADDGVQVLDFTALEDIPMGPITYPGHTEAEQRIHAAEHYYTSDSWDAPNITTHQRITFLDGGNGTTTVNEKITFLANPLLLAFTVDNGVASHRAYQEALKHDIENGTL